MCRARVPSRRPLPACCSRRFAADGTSLYDGTVLPSWPIARRIRRRTRAPCSRCRLARSACGCRSRIEAAQPIDTDVRDLSVRDLSGSVVLGTAAFMRARTALDYRALENDPDAAPVASREFSRTERLMIRVPGLRPEWRADLGVGASPEPGRPDDTRFAGPEGDGRSVRRIRSIYCSRVWPPDSISSKWIAEEPGW